MKPTHILAALIAVITWGINFVVIKIGLQGLPPVLFTASRFIFSALPLVFFVSFPKTSWKWVVAYGMFQFAFQFTLLFCGIKLGFPAGLASLVMQLQAFITMGLAVVIMGEKPQFVQVLGALIALSGMALVAMHLEAQATIIGFLLVVAGAVCWSIANIVTKKIGVVNPLAMVVWGSAIASPPLLLASYMMEGMDAWQAAYAQLNWTSIGAIAYQSYPNTIVGFGIWSWLMRKYPAATIAPFTLLVPVVGMVTASIVLNETLFWWKICAGLLVLGGLACNQFGLRIWSWFKPAAAT
ncbi:O-acetylserine/cysteine exporter [Undibacterium sp. YM2]|jgi:O-acetylserine/cysteine efflux transporter|uniref:EamA family transporter n=1 Tax=Undibacterium sp. YM2 TaxID=2058625 RepID=UPI001331D7D3|nr:EamA family transporter [Undibacterium sp. YM2]BBB67441.1 O-acetylserine/cysteine exporter [Undibacterium sp. YM2]